MFQSLLSNTSVYLIANVMSAGIPLLLLPILTRVLDPSQYGMVAMFVVLIGAAKSVAVSPFIGAINRKYFDKYSIDDYQSFVGSGLLLIAFAILILSSAVLYTSDMLTDKLGIPPLWLVLVIYVTLNNALIELILGQWQIRKQPKKYASIQIMLPILNVVSSLLLVLLLEWGAFGRVSGIVFSYSTVALICLYVMLKLRFINLLNLQRKYFREITKFSLPLMPHMVGGLMLSTFDRFIIATKLDLKSVGIYFAALQIVMIAKVIFDALNKAFTPWLYEQLNKDSQKINSQIIKATYLWFMCIWLGVAACFYLASHITDFILGQNFHDASHLLGWLAVSIAFKGMYLMVANYCFYAKRTGYLSAISIVTGCMTLIFMLHFIERYGLVGIAYGTAVGMGIRFLGVWWLANHCHHMPWFTAFKIQREKE